MSFVAFWRRFLYVENGEIEKVGAPCFWEHGFGLRDGARSQLPTAIGIL
jgi:hypothetical protein